VGKTPGRAVPEPTPEPGRPGTRRWAAAAVLLLVLGGLGFTEASGVTNLRGTVIRLFSPQGTLVVEVDDPEVSVKIDGSDLVITGAGAREIRLKPGSYTVEASKDGKVVSRELVSVAKNGRQVVRVSQEALPPPIKKEGWTVLKPIEMQSEGGATLTLQNDGSILAGGKHPDKDVYTLTFRGLPARIEALRLEVLPHDSLPNKGPGRHESGEFVLTTVRAQLHPPTKPSVSSTLKLADAWADNSRGDDSVVGLAIDAEDNTGWVTEVGKPHFAVFKLAEPAAATDSTMLRVALEFKWEGAQRQLGCFRISVASDANAVKDPDRRAAESVLSKGGTVKVNDQDQEIKAAADLPRESFRLTFVSLQDNKQATDADLAHFKDCKNLTYLNLRGTQVSDAGLVHFKDCKNLRVLFVSFTGIGDAGVAHFKDCKDLTDLELRFTQVTDAGLAHFKDCRNLTYLNLTCANVSDAGLAHLKECRSLKNIALDGTRVTDAGLAHLKNCKDLTELVLPGLPITDEGLAHLKACKNLTFANLNETKVSDTSLAQLKDCQDLTFLNVQKTKVTAAGIDELKKALSGCKIEWDGGVIEPR
jgi:hypothetical protein